MSLRLEVGGKVVVTSAAPGETMSMEAEYERTRDRARAFLSAIDELSTFRDQVASSSEDGKESLENALEVSERGVVNQRHRWQRGT